MASTRTLVLLTLVVSTVVSATPIAPQPKVQYVNCRDQTPAAIQDNLTQTNTTLPQSLPASLKCGYVTVPMDYSKPLAAGNSVNVSFAINAINSPKGLLLYNPGGPGSEVSKSILGRPLSHRPNHPHGQLRASRLKPHTILLAWRISISSVSLGGLPRGHC